MDGTTTSTPYTSGTFVMLTEENKKTEWPTWLANVKTETGRQAFTGNGLKTLGGIRIRKRVEFILAHVKEPEEKDFQTQIPESITADNKVKAAHYIPLTDRQDEQYEKALSTFVSSTSIIDIIVRTNLAPSLFVAYNSGGNIIHDKFQALQKMVGHDADRALRIARNSMSKMIQGDDEDLEEYLNRFHSAKLAVEQQGYPGQDQREIGEWNKNMGVVFLQGIAERDRINAHSKLSGYQGFDYAKCYEVLSTSFATDRELYGPKVPKLTAMAAHSLTKQGDIEVLIAAVAKLAGTGTIPTSRKPNRQAQLYVSGLALNTTSDQLKSHFSTLKIHSDSFSKVSKFGKCFGLIMLQDGWTDLEVQEAVSEFDGTVLNGRPIKVAKATIRNYSKHEKRILKLVRGVDGENHTQEGSLTSNTTQLHEKQQTEHISFSATPEAGNIEAFLDSACSSSLTARKEILQDQTITKPVSYATAGGKTISSSGIQGSVMVNGNILVSKVQHVPVAPVSLIGISDILTAGKDVWFNHKDRTACVGTLANPRDNTIDCKIDEEHGTWKVMIGGKAFNESKVAFLGNGKPSTKDMNLWHSRFMHVSPDIIRRTAKVVHGLTMSGSKNSNDLHCEPCVVGKMHTLPYGPSRDRGSGILSNVSADIFFPGNGQQGHRGVIGMLGVNVHNTQLRLAYPVKKKSETTGLLKFAKAFLERTTGEKLLKLYFDSAGENASSELLEACKTAGIQIEYTCTQAHNQNGEIDGWFRATLDMVRSNLHETGVPAFLWPETFLSAVQVWNRTSHGVVDGRPMKTPYELTFKQQPSLRDLRVPNCLAYVHIKDAGKINPRAAKGRFIGYANPDGHAKLQRGYEIMLYPSGKVVVSRDVYFVENQFNIKTAQTPQISNEPIAHLQFTHYDDDVETYSAPPNSEVHRQVMHADQDVNDGANQAVGDGTNNPDDEFATPMGTVDGNSDVDDDDDVEEPVDNAVETPIVNAGEEPPPIPEPLRRSDRERKRPDFYLAGMAVRTVQFETTDTKEFITDLTPISLYVNGVAFLTESGPRNIRQALLMPEWAKVIQKELQQFEDMGSWTLVDYTGQHLLNTIWVLTRKHVETPNPVNKARLVIDGSKQLPSEFNKIFASTPYRESVKFFQAACTHKDMDMSKGDVTGAYHNAKCDKDIYVKPPVGMVLREEDKGKVLKLINGVYGIRQGARLWQDIRNGFLEEYGFQECPGAACMFKRKADDGSQMLMVWHTDDGVLGCENKAETSRFWTWL